MNRTGALFCRFGGVIVGAWLLWVACRLMSELGTLAHVRSLHEDHGLIIAWGFYCNGNNELTPSNFAESDIEVAGKDWNRWTANGFKLDWRRFVWACFGFEIIEPSITLGTITHLTQPRSYSFDVVGFEIRKQTSLVICTLDEATYYAFDDLRKRHCEGKRLK